MGYLTIEEADELVDSMYKSNQPEFKYWSSLSDKDKQIDIDNGSDMIDTCMFKGHRVKRNSVFPRYIDNVLFELPPLSVQKAIIKISITKRLISKEEQLREMGVTSYKIADASITFKDTDKKTVNNIPIDIYRNYIQKYCLC